MENLDKVVSTSLDNYFYTLSKLGYFKQSGVNTLLLLTFLYDFLKEFEWIISEEDYNLVNDIIICLHGNSCLVPYNEHILANEPLDNYLINIPIRLSDDDSNIRISESINLRLPDLL